MSDEIEIQTTTSIQTSQNKGKGKASEEEKPVPKQLANEYQLKAIEWDDPSSRETRRLKVITQNENGPCPLLALCNVLLLRGVIEIKPYDRPSVTYDYLVELLGDYLLKTIPHGEAEIQKGLENLTIDKSPPKDQVQQEMPEEFINGTDNSTDKGQVEAGDEKTKNENVTSSILTYARPSLQDYHHTLNAALSIIPSLQTGLDVNVRFNSIHGFEPTAELSVFDVFNVELVHGWVVDPQDQDTWDVVVGKCESYNKAVECVVRGDSGVVSESSEKKSDGKPENDASVVERIRDAEITSHFLESNATQLTYHGLLTLSETLPPGNLCVFFRNNHFSTLYKHPKTSVLYILVTDAGFVHERSVVWESLIDVDQNASEFVDGKFRKCEATSGDYVDVTEVHEVPGGGDQECNTMQLHKYHLQVVHIPPRLHRENEKRRNKERGAALLADY
ncbi:11373_t:CDS:2 [Acaulospora morrowiae]|uniref:11373_t:CDS:1 n=1 Tax=Acaulospora morrowiae TaxID=94023 RepID=A0A9N9B253_9GLOM|nr:11373_t:CDS:2 [Acaulospora morrowiae]